MENRPQASNSFLAPSPGRVRAGLAILRVVVGIIFIMHGGQKLFVWGVAGTAAGFAKMGVPLPQIAGPAIGVIELACGILLILGLLTPIAALLLAADMLGAILLVHIHIGFFLPMGFEYPLALLAAAITLALAGPGAFAVDDALAHRRE